MKINLSSSDKWGIAGALLILVLSVLDNAYIMFVGYGLALIIGVFFFYRKILSLVALVSIVIAGLIALCVGFIILIR